jgi:hypothetical protein
MRRGDDLQPPLRIQLVGTEDGADFVVEEFGERPRDSAPCAISSGEKAWMCMSGHTAFTARQIER